MKALSLLLSLLAIATVTAQINNSTAQLSPPVRKQMSDLALTRSQQATFGYMLVGPSDSEAIHGLAYLKKLDKGARNAFLARCAALASDKKAPLIANKIIGEEGSRGSKRTSGTKGVIGEEGIIGPVDIEAIIGEEGIVSNKLLTHILIGMSKSDQAAFRTSWSQTTKKDMAYAAYMATNAARYGRKNGK